MGTRVDHSHTEGLHGDKGRPLLHKCYQVVRLWDTLLLDYGLAEWNDIIHITNMHGSLLSLFATLQSNHSVRLLHGVNFLPHVTNTEDIHACK